MTNARYASLHAGMMERRSTKGDYDGGKVVKSLMPAPSAEPKIEFSRSRGATPPIRSLLNQVADWTALPEDNNRTFGKRLGGHAAPAPKPMVTNRPTASERTNAGRFDADQPVSSDKTVHGLASSTHTDIPAVSQTKPKRRALTLRLELENHRRLRLASANLGRSCQDILHTAMDTYLAAQGYNKMSEGDD